MKATLMLLLAGAGSAAAYTVLRARQRRDEKQALKTEIRKWEDEGGNVPQVPTVSPVAAPEASVPQDR